MFGCLIAGVVIVCVLYGGIIGAGFLIWGRGFYGAAKMHRSPLFFQQPINAILYDSVIDERADRFLFHRTLWSELRFGLLAGMASLMIYLLWARRRATRRRALTMLLIVTAVGALYRYGRDPGISLSATELTESSMLGGGKSVPIRNHRLTVEAWQIGGGKSGTRYTKSLVEGWNVILLDAEGRVESRLVTLPFEERNVAEKLRDAIARKVGVPGA
jgi:hypothetical protein